MAARELTIKYVLKQIFFAFLVAAIVLVIYLTAVNTKSQDQTIGKYAFMNSNGNYLGKIKGRGRSSKTQNVVYFIEEPTGGVIEIPMKYVEVRDKFGND
jgi:hypothetical protein